MKSLFLVLLFCFISLSSVAQEIYSLQRILETGLERNFDIRIVRNDQKISDNNATRGNAGMLPNLDLNAGYNGTLTDTKQNNYDNSTTRLNSVLNQGANVGLALNWTLFDGFQMQTEYARLKEFQKQGEIQTRVAIETLVTDLMSEYYTYVRQTLRLKNLRYAVSLSKERLRIVEAHYTIGSKSMLDVEQARVDYNSDRSELIQQYEVVQTSAITLNRLMAVDNVSQKWQPADSVIAPGTMLDRNALWEKTLSANSHLLLAEKNKMLSRLDMKAVQSRYLPYLKLNAGYGYTLSLYDRDYSSVKHANDWGLNYGLTLGYNLFDGRNRNREKKNARIAMQNSELAYQKLEQSLDAELSRLYMAYHNNLELNKLEQENLQVARDHYVNAMERYRLGDLAGIELREAQNSLLEAEERLLEAQFNTKLCEISLLQISGQLAELF